VTFVSSRKESFVGCPSDEEFTDFAAAAWPWLYRTAFLLVGNHADAEDLVQTTLAKTYASWGRVRELDAAGGYARTVLVNTASSWFRRRSWRNELPRWDIPEDVSYTDPSTGAAIHDALQTLTKRQRAVVVARFYLDLDVRQTAAALKCSEGTVKSQTSLALSKLRAHMNPEKYSPQGAVHD
jgi:RNA polymerase sigma-70 factor (sigma-E family)